MSWCSGTGAEWVWAAGRGASLAGRRSLGTNWYLFLVFLSNAVDAGNAGARFRGNIVLLNLPLVLFFLR